MNLAALRSVSLALTLAACSQSEPPVPEFQTVVIDLREPGTRLADGGPSVPLPTRKPQYAAAAPTTAATSTVAAASTQSHGSIIASVRYLQRLLPDFNQITNCPNGITCQAFAN